MNRIESIEQRLAEHKRLCEIPFFDATGEDDMYLRAYRKQLLEDIRPLLAVVKAADELSACASALKRYEVEGEDPFIEWDAYYMALYAANRRYQAALAVLEKPVDSGENPV